MCRFDGLLDVLLSGDKRLSEFHVHTSGYGVTPERARQLRRAGLEAAGIGFDHWDRERFDAIRGYPGAMDQATQAIRCFEDAGVFTYLNTCLTKELVRNGGLSRLLDDAAQRGVGMVRLLEPKPCGGYCGEDPHDLFTEGDRRQVEEFFIHANKARRFRHHPPVVVPSHTEAPHRLGCRMGGQAIFEIDSQGNVLPCIFVPVSFGSILDEDFTVVFNRMREAVPRPVRAPCPALTLAPAINESVSAGLEPPIPYSHVKAEFDRVAVQAS
jgi:MoaA/NifB/PqqE/SkfB family radical SAM enzyme